MKLNTSDRIKLIKECAERLAPEEYSIIDLTLEQFGFPVSDRWNGTKFDYVLEMLRNASSPPLTDLAQHVGVEFETRKDEGLQPPFWRDGMLRVFISHLAKHRAYTGELQEAFLSHGISGFVAHKDITPTAEWQVQIETALATCDAFVALLHPGFHESNWTDQEIGYAMGRGVPIYAVRLGQDPYGFIGRFQAFNGNGKDAAGLAAEIFDKFRTDKRTSAKMMEILMSMFEQSGSFAQAKARLEYLEALTDWHPSFAPRLVAAKEGNSQINGSWGVPARIDALVAKWR